MDKVINQLTQDLKPVKRLAHPLLRFMFWLVLGLAYGAGVLHSVGLRPDLDGAVMSASFLLEVFLMGAMGVSAGLAAFNLCVPDMRQQDWLKGAPFLFLLVFAVWEGIKMLTGQADVPHFHLHWYACLQNSLFFFTVPALIITWMTAAKGAGTQPVWQMVMNALCVSALGYVGLRLTCPLDTIAHDVLYHIVPFIFLGSALGALAQRFFRW